MYEIAVAGYIASDMFPEFAPAKSLSEIFVPGKLICIGKLQTAVGGVVGNTGIALNRLGVPTALIAKVGKDDVASMIQNTIESTYGLKTFFTEDEKVGSPYTLAIEVPGIDRVLLPYTGTNNVFYPEDVDFDVVKECKIFHFGYPSLMESMYEEGGAARLNAMYDKAHELGVATSLDQALPDPNSDAGKVDWKSYLEEVLPHTDIFMPSAEELLYMVDKAKYDELKAMDEDVLKNLSMDDLPYYGKMLKDMGAKIVAIKCGTMGFYLTAADEAALSAIPGIPIDAAAWANAELFSMIFHVEKVVSTTGSGDSSIAGLLAAIARGYSPEKAIDTACASGAMCVGAYGSVEGIRPLTYLDTAIGSEMIKRKGTYTGSEWTYDEEHAVYRR